jgi:hypothetical protein
VVRHSLRERSLMSTGKMLTAPEGRCVYLFHSNTCLYHDYIHEE